MRSVHMDEFVPQGAGGKTVGRAGLRRDFLHPGADPAVGHVLLQQQHPGETPENFFQQPLSVQGLGAVNAEDRRVDAPALL